jgi:predicted nuclease with TOPRIM domain
MSDETIRDLRSKLQAMAEDYQDLHAENGDLRKENARLKGWIEVLQEQWDRLPTKGRT